LQADPDVICLQEIKASRSTSVTDFELAGYPYHYWFPATKKGYSGVAILSRKPNDIVFGTGIPHMDFEGRNIRVDFDEMSVMSLYLPSE
jgi:exodeoxyribonuclease-3